MRARSPRFFCLVLVIVLAQAASSCRAVPDAPLARGQCAKIDPSPVCCASNSSESSPYILIGDLVIYRDALNREHSGSDRVGLDGTIFVPELGSVHVAGLTRPELEARLEHDLAEALGRSEITVATAVEKGHYSWVLGEVGAQVESPCRRDWTVLEAVQHARSGNPGAHPGRVRLIRADPRDPRVVTVYIKDLVCPCRWAAAVRLSGDELRGLVEPVGAPPAGPLEEDQE